MDSLGSLSAGYRVADRRRKPRTHEPFGARVRGIDGRGDPFDLEAALDNLSAGGLYMRLKRHVEEGLPIFIFLQLATRLMPGVKGASRRGARKGGAVGAAARRRLRRRGSVRALPLPLSFRIKPELHAVPLGVQALSPSAPRIPRIPAKV